MKYKFRRIVPQFIKRWLRPAACLSLFSDRRSFAEFARMHRSSEAVTGDSKLAELRMRRLGGRSVTLRTPSSDAQVLFSAYFHRYHLPPNGIVSNDAKRIVDLGCNIGLTIADFAVTYPQAELLGVELDDSNLALCERNVQPWMSRCKLVHGAVWFEDGTVEYARQAGNEHGYSIQSAAPRSAMETVVAKAHSVQTLLHAWASDEEIDYMKIDIEGAEAQLLQQNTEWCRQVKCLKVEVHGDYAPQACVADLTRLGFRSWRDQYHAHCVIGVRG